MNASLLEQPSTLAPKSHAPRRVVWSSVLGSTVEWYDFLIYGTAAACSLTDYFSPSFRPAIGTIAAFASYVLPEAPTRRMSMTTPEVE